MSKFSNLARSAKLMRSLNKSPFLILRRENDTIDLIFALSSEHAKRLAIEYYGKADYTALAIESVEDYRIFCKMLTEAKTLAREQKEQQNPKQTE